MKDGKSYECGFWAGFAAMFLVALVTLICVDINEIKPIHVYQGRTTLEYRVIDGQVIDSTVVWREE